MYPDTVVCWKWRPYTGYRSQFSAETVNTLRRMVARHYPHRHRFLCVTDDPEGLDPQVEAVPLWNDWADVPHPSGALRNPSCFRRLRAYHPDIGDVFGRRFVSLDLDLVLVGDVTPLWDRPEDFVIWGDTHPTTRYNASMFLLTSGSRRQVWDTFDPVESPKASLAAKQFGSDQGWVSTCLGDGEATWGTADGVYSYRNHLVPRGSLLPSNAKVVVFHGHIDPWGAAAQQIPWVQEHYR